MKKILPLILCLILCIGNINAQNKNSKSDPSQAYNVQRGIEALYNNDAKEAQHYFLKELENSPSNYAAYLWLGAIARYDQAYGQAISYYDKALKYVPKKEKKIKASCYTNRGNAYFQMQDYGHAIEDYQSALKLVSDDPEIYDGLGDIYFYMKDYESSTKMYEKIIKLEPGSGLGQVGIGRNILRQGKYAESIPYFDKAIQLHNEYSAAYTFRAESYIGLKRYHEAADDVIRAIEIDGSTKGYMMLKQFKKENYTLLLAKLKIKQQKYPNDAKWQSLIGVVHQYNHEYKKAIEAYKSYYAETGQDNALYWIAQCQYARFNLAGALQYTNDYLSKDSNDVDFLSLRAMIYMSQEKYDLAVNDVTACIKAYPDESSYYYTRAVTKRYSGDYAGAVEDCNLALVIAPNVPHYYMERGNSYKASNDAAAAEADFKKVLELDTSSLSDQRLYAFTYLGRREEALSLLDSIYRKNAETLEEGDCYNFACVYSILNEPDSALHYLHKSFEIGYRDTTHINHDRDLDNIKKLPEFAKLMEEFRTALSIENSETTSNTDSLIEKVTEIPFTREGNLCKVKCTLNGLSLYFYFDTGASDVTISNVEASFMLKNNYLTKQDIVGKQNYMTASGDIAEGTVINLRNVNFGGFDLNNVQASVVKSQTAPLLLGQTVLQKLGKIEIDNEKQVLRITYKEKE